MEAMELCMRLLCDEGISKKINACGVDRMTQASKRPTNHDAFILARQYEERDREDVTQDVLLGPKPTFNDDMVD